LLCGQRVAQPLHRRTQRTAHHRSDERGGDALRGRSGLPGVLEPDGRATRGLLLDLLASGERAGVDDAMELFIELSEPLFDD
jgi:hypothetical protein